jgi:DNA polymerase-3 subunit delta
MIIFLYGEDTFLARRKLNDLRDKFLREVDPSGNSLAVLDGASATMEKINESVSASSLLSKKRMVIIENLFTNKSQTIFNQVNDYFKKRKIDLPAPDRAGGQAGDNIIIFLDSISGEDKLPKYKSELFKTLIKQKYAQEFKMLSNTEATTWTKKEVEARGGKISHQATMELTSLLGSDLWQINNEIDKLINYKASQKLGLADNEKGSVIEAEDVKNLVRGQFDEKIFSLTDAISARNKAQAVKLLEEQTEAGLTDSYLLTMITRQFRIMLQIKQALDSGHTSRKIISLLKLHPFIVQKGINQVRNFTLPSLKNILGKLVEIDYLMKSGKAEIKPMLSLLIARI